MDGSGYPAAFAADGGTGRSATFTIDGPVQVQVTVHELADGTLRFDLAVTGEGGKIGDLNGLYFQLADKGLVGGLAVSGDDVIGSTFGVGSANNLGKGNNMNGSAANGVGGFDGAVAFSEAGIGRNKDDVQEASFVLAHDSAALTLDMLLDQAFGARLTSVGEEGGRRNDSVKLTAQPEITLDPAGPDPDPADPVDPDPTDPDPTDPDPDPTDPTDPDGPGKAKCFTLDGDVQVRVVMTELADGGLKFDVEVLTTDGRIGDLNGLYLNIADPALLAGLTVSGDDVIGSAVGEGSVSSLGGGNNVNGSVANAVGGGFDLGVAFSQPGIGGNRGDVQEASFVLRSDAGPLRVADFDGQAAAARLTSVGEAGGPRNDSLKLGDVIECKDEPGFPGEGRDDEDEDPAPASLGDFVFHDLNGDGIQDEGEPGIGGATVRLLDEDGTVLDVTQTDDAGFYLFDGLQPEIAYRVQFVLPEGFDLASPRQAGDDIALDSDGPLSDAVVLQPDEFNDTLDAGFFKLASLGDRVWYDIDGDGLQGDPLLEPGVPDVTVTLLDGDGSVVAVTTTDENGLYLFEDLLPGSYRVRFDDLPEGLALTAPQVGDDDTVDSDPAPDSGVTRAITLSSGEAFLDLDAGLISLGPDLQDDAARLCANEVVTLDVLGNDTDVTGGGLAITGIEVDGEIVAIAEGGSVTLQSGATVTLAGGKLVYDLTGPDDFDDLTVGDCALDTVVYQVTDGFGGVATAEAQIEVFGALNTLETIQASLPETVEFSLANVGVQFAEITVSAPGFDALDGLVTRNVFCVDDDRDLIFGQTFTAEVFLAVEGGYPPGLIQQEENLDLVNWIINQDFRADGFTGQEIQAAIWNLTDDKPINLISLFGSNAKAQQIVDLARANGEGFEAGADDVVGLLLNPVGDDGNVQPFIVGVPFRDLEQDCVICDDCGCA